MSVTFHSLATNVIKGSLYSEDIALASQLKQLKPANKNTVFVLLSALHSAHKFSKLIQIRTHSIAQKVHINFGRF